MGAYDSARATALRLLKKKGKSVVITRPHTGVINEITGSRTPGAPLTATFLCVGLPPGKSAEYQVGTLIGRNIEEFHLGRTAGSLDPAPGDTIPWKGKTWTLLWSAVYDPDESGFVYAKAYGEIA